MLSLAAMVLGALLLILVPVLLVGLAFAHIEATPALGMLVQQSYHLSGTLVIGSAAGGMALLIIGATLRD